MVGAGLGCTSKQPNGNVLYEARDVFVCPARCDESDERDDGMASISGDIKDVGDGA